MLINSCHEISTDSLVLLNTKKYFCSSSNPFLALIPKLSSQIDFKFFLKHLKYHFDDWGPEGQLHKHSCISECRVSWTMAGEEAATVLPQ